MCDKDALLCKTIWGFLLQTQISLTDVKRFPTFICPEIPQDVSHFLSWLLSSGVIFCHINSPVPLENFSQGYPSTPWFFCDLFLTILWAHARRMTAHNSWSSLEGIFEDISKSLSLNAKSLSGFRPYRRIHILNLDTAWDSAPLILCVRSWIDSHGIELL